MAQINLFLLLPETEPTNQWMQSTETNYYEVDAYEALIDELKKIVESITIETYEGFYDALNVKNFFDLYDTLDDCYPSAPKKIFRSVISKNAFINWREEAIQKQDNDYQIFKQATDDNTFCEIAERKCTVSDDHYALLNHHVCIIKNTIVVTINKESVIKIDNLTDEKEISEWFAQNRLPPRNFKANPKHGENRQDIRIINGETISPLRCSSEKAWALLQNAIGNSDRALYNIDPDYDEIIVFKYEGPTPQNMYHGYHVPKNSEEVPVDIRKKLRR
jgi:hypothetical protein